MEVGETRGIVCVREHHEAHVGDFIAVCIERAPAVFNSFDTRDFCFEPHAHSVAGRDLRAADRARRYRIATRKEPAAARYVHARDARRVLRRRRRDIIAQKTESFDGDGQRLRIVGGIGDLQQTVAAAMQFVARVFERLPAVERVQKSRAREA